METLLVLTLKRLALAAVGLSLALVASCSEDADPPTTTAPALASGPPVATESPSPSPSPSASPSPTTSSSEFSDLPVEQQRMLAVGAAASTFDDFQTELESVIKQDPTLEALEELRFDREQGALVIGGESGFEGASGRTLIDGQAYDLATMLAPAYWGSQFTSRFTDPSVLPSLSIRLDDQQYVCDGVAMAALADKELSQDSFVSACTR